MTEHRFVEEPDFRTLAAPGLDEDELYAAIQGLPGKGALWGEGRAEAFPPVEPSWDADAERHQRHAQLLERWSSEEGPGR